mmetsp:Transcript_14981/g.22633  ORF Transcript_14981/g.22633 Transcript_14981/m.22633 type:complete len:685 (+) Transcript_14981:116-2170(+)
MQKQLNTVHRQTRKTYWRYLFYVLYLTPIFVIWSSVFLWLKRTKKDIMEQKDAYKVINIVTSGIHSTANPDLSHIFSDTTHSISFLKLKKCIEYACNDDTVLGISLITDNGIEIGYAQTQELREELRRFKHEHNNEHKFIAAYGKSADMKEYLLSTVCDEFYLMEPAILNIYGFAFPQLFFKKLFQNIGVKPYVLKREKYKNFADTFVEDEMSQEHRDNLSSLGSDLYSQFLSIVYKTLSSNGDERYQSLDDVKEIVNHAPYVSAEAVEKGLITNTMQWKDYQVRLSQLGYQQLQSDSDSEQASEPDILFLSPSEYLTSYEFAEQRDKKKKIGATRSSRSFLKFLGFEDGKEGPQKLPFESTETDTDAKHVEPKQHRAKSRDKHIALINVIGEIHSGESEGTMVGSDTVEHLIRSASANEDVIAMVLRIDSPGGDAIASESIWNAVYDAKVNGKKPIIVSMGDMCASGGYYIASAADKIFALPGTITGSIGVVMMSMSLNELLTEKLHINYDQSVKFGENSDIMLPFEYPTERLQERYETMIEALYQIFMQRVATGRNFDMEHVRNIAQGKVWSGQQAMKIGLVDGLGGLTEAKLAAEQLAGLGKDEHVKLLKYATKMEKFMDMLDGLGDTVATTKYKSSILPILSQFAALLKFKLWITSVHSKMKQFQTMTNEPKPYFLCLDF